MRSGLRLPKSVASFVLFMSNFTVIRSPALVLSPVKPASKTFSQSVPCGNVEVVQSRCLNTEGLAKLVKCLVVRPNRVLGKQLAPNLQLIFKFSCSYVIEAYNVFSSHWAVKGVPVFSQNLCCSCCLLQCHENIFQAREGALYVNQVLVC